jgi:predicted dehydrogenase
MNTRRDFLQKIGLSALALQLAPLTNWAAEKPVTEQPYEGRVLRVAILGLGSYATRVAEAMRGCTKAKLVGAISGTPAKLTDWQSKYGIPVKNCYNYSNFDEIKHNPDIDAVYIITPNGLHREEAIRVAKAGKHVICEKPMALNAKQGQDMIDACKQAGVQLLLFFQGLCGFTIGDPNQWRLNKALSGGGSMMDIGIYAVNGARYMIGQDPIWVTAQETKKNPVKFKDGVDETMQFQFGFPDGAMASCLSTYDMDNLDKFFLNGTGGFAEMQPSTNYGPIMGHTNKGELNAPITVHQTVQMDEMSEIIFNGKKPVVPIDGYEALKDLKLIDAIYLAARTGKRVDVEL